jgi:hypothetical protein
MAIRLSLDEMKARTSQSVRAFFARRARSMFAGLISPHSSWPRRDRPRTRLSVLVVASVLSPRRADPIMSLYFGIGLSHSIRWSVDG